VSASPAIRLPDPSLVVLVGAPGAGKSHWAREWFDARQVVSSDQLRGVVGLDEYDQRASKDAFAVLDLIVERRLKRRLTTVVDSTALERERRAAYIAAARKAKVPVFAIVFETEDDVCRARNRERARPVPANVLKGQLETARMLRAAIHAEEFDGAYVAGPIEVVPREYLHAPAFAARQKEAPVPLQFGVHVSRFDADVASVAGAAEAAGFTQLTVMDHFVQIPGVGREWEDMLESYTTLGYMAGVTSTIRLHALVTGITYATSRTSGRRSRPSTSSPAGARSVDSAQPGSSASTSCTGGGSLRSPSATSCWRTRCSCSPCCGVPGRLPSKDGPSRSPKPCATRDRCRNGSRSSSAAAARSAR
jgi:predicted kinase